MARLLEFMKTIGSYLKQHRANTPEQICRDVKEYIRNHYANPKMSTSTIAEAFHFNASYLSGAFSNTTHTTITNYINSVRLGAGLRISESDEYENQSDCGESRLCALHLLLHAVQAGDRHVALPITDCSSKAVNRYMIKLDSILRKRFILLSLVPICIVTLVFTVVTLYNTRSRTEVSLGQRGPLLAASLCRRSSTRQTESPP